MQTIKLYERCLIACANYPEYWIRYVQRMDAEGKLESALDALERASTVFVKVCFPHLLDWVEEMPTLACVLYCFPAYVFLCMFNLSAYKNIIIVYHTNVM